MNFLDYDACQRLPHVNKISNKTNQLLNILGFEGDFDSVEERVEFYEWVRANCKKVKVPGAGDNMGIYVKCVCGQPCKDYAYVYNPKFNHVIRCGNVCIGRVGLGKANHCLICDKLVRHDSVSGWVCDECNRWKSIYDSFWKQRLDMMLEEWSKINPVNVLRDKILDQCEDDRCRKCTRILKIK